MNEERLRRRLARQGSEYRLVPRDYLETLTAELGTFKALAAERRQALASLREKWSTVVLAAEELRAPRAASSWSTRARDFLRRLDEVVDS